MTGEPSFNFRDSESEPICHECGDTMSHDETEESVVGEIDVYRCPGCGATQEDSWSY